MTQRKYDLEERLLQFAVRVTTIVESLPDTKVCNHLGGQLLRSGTSPALNYGEAQAAESKRDFIHKLGIILIERNNELPEDSGSEIVFIRYVSYKGER
jgi:four helix bundle protein